MAKFFPSRCSIVWIKDECKSKIGGKRVQGEGGKRQGLTSCRQNRTHKDDADGYNKEHCKEFYACFQCSVILEDVRRSSLDNFLFLSLAAARLEYLVSYDKI